MALTDAYISLAELKAQAGDIGDTANDTELTRVTVAVSRAIERFCGRNFNDAESVSARQYHASTATSVRVDDFSTATGLVVESDTGGNGLFATTIAASNFTLCPLNGIVDGQPGHPFREIVLHDGQTFVGHGARPTVQVTARWGWAAVPADVKEAALIQASQVFGRKYSHNGVIGFGEFVVRVSSRLDPDVQRMLQPYVVHALVA